MEELNEIVLTEKKFSKMVEDFVQSNNISYINAVLEICSYKEIDPSDVSSLISNHIREKIYNEALDEKLIRGNQRLPI